MPPKPGGRSSEKERLAVSWRRGSVQAPWSTKTTVVLSHIHHNYPYISIPLLQVADTPVFSKLGQVSMPSSTRKVSSQRMLHEVRSYQYHCFPDGTPYSTLLILQPPGLCLVKALRQTTRPPASQPSIHQNDMFLILTYAGQTTESRS